MPGDVSLDFLNCLLILLHPVRVGLGVERLVRRRDRVRCRLYLPHRFEEGLFIEQTIKCRHLLCQFRLTMGCKLRPHLTDSKPRLSDSSNTVLVQCLTHLAQTVVCLLEGATISS